MNLQYLGDALDHWKGSVFQTLQAEDVLRGFSVDAMVSDASAWKPTDRKLFARLLRIEESQVVHHNHDLCHERERYFGEIPSQGDLFLDPDTGVTTGRVERIEQYLRPDELFSAIEREKDRVVVVYQHVRAQKTRVRVEQVLDRLRKQKQKFFCASYESGTVALLFFSQESKRIVSVRDCFRGLLGSHANNRIGYWNCHAA